ncbi:MAG: AAA family ATPase [Pseudomonadales bacterium]|nr:AAA family ATPase [Pseudomonadales bacterium]
MSILIDTVRILGFRGIQNLEITLPKTTVLIGTNNSGKTSVIKALQLALGDYSRYVSEEDFHIDKSDNVAEQILVDVRVLPVDTKGKRSDKFTDEWVNEYADNIQAEPDGRQFLAIRTRCIRDEIKGGFDVSRFILNRWPDISNWETKKTSAKNQLRRRFDAMPFIAIDAQRDIHQELRDRSSFVGKILSSVKYNDSDIELLEEMIGHVNNEAVEKSEPLKGLKTHLEQLNRSFHGSGKAEITPFPKKIRDLSKQFTVHFGETENDSFSMEYHGMGTRSWASMLTVKAFVELLASKHEEEVKPFFPVIAAEEPEAHLHPNAQRTLYQQLTQSLGQVILSSHSPYLAGMANLPDIRALSQSDEGIKVNALTVNLDAEDLNVLHREVMRFRGELLFSKAIILFEGVTEEQIVPAMFEHYYGSSTFAMGINCISVAGKNYAPYIKLGCSFGIPVYVVSDNDGNTKTSVEAQIQNIKNDTGLRLEEEIFSIHFLNDSNDIESELINTLNLREEVCEALVLSKTRGSSNENLKAAKQREVTALSNEELVEKMRKSKASYAGFLADVISRNPQNRNQGEMVPEAFKQAFNKIKEQLS